MPDWTTCQKKKRKKRKRDSHNGQHKDKGVAYGSDHVVRS